MHNDTQEWELIYKEEPDIKKLLTDYVEPYFYSQSYFEANGKWPWRHYAHNAEGLVQWYLEKWRLDSAAVKTAQEIVKLRTKDKFASRITEKALGEARFSFWNDCLCESGKTYIDCHPVLAKLADELRSA